MRVDVRPSGAYGDVYTCELRYICQSNIQQICRSACVILLLACCSTVHVSSSSQLSAELQACATGGNCQRIVWYPRMLIARTEPAPGRVCVCVCVRVCVRACVHTHDDTQATNIHGSMEFCACTQGHPDIDRHSQTDTHTQTHATNKSNYQIMHGKIVPGEKGDVAEKPLTHSCLNGL